MEANAEQRQIVDSYTIDLQARIAEAVKQSVNPPAPAGKRRRSNKESTEASGLLPMTGEIEQQVRKTFGNMVADAAKPISRTLTTGELYRHSGPTAHCGQNKWLQPSPVKSLSRGH